MKKSLKLRILTGVGVPLGALLLIAACLFLKNTPPCLFYQLTGLHCPGCGAGRFMLAILRADPYAALRAQPLLFISFPFLCYYVAKLYIAFVFGRDVLPFPRIRNRWFGITVAVVIIAYWILRNIPAFPFTLLAPSAAP
jgi:hypothetical protein